MKEKLKYFLRAISVIFCLVAVIIAFSLFSQKASGLPLRLFTILSGSMQPGIPVGSLAVDVSQKQYENGDVVTYKTPDGRRNVTHRIVQTTESEEGKKYIIKGDTNPLEDPQPISEGLILGKVWFTIPHIGYLVAFTHTPLGLVILIIIPASFLIFMEIQYLQKIIKEEIARKTAVNPNWYKLNYYKLIFLLSFLLGFVTVLNIQVALSFLSDTAQVTGNNFSISSSFAQAILTLSDDKKKISFTVKNIAGYKKLSYKLTYDTNDLPQGFEGTIDLHGENEVIREFELATCSSGGTCVYHTGVKNFQLNIDLEDNVGNKTTLQASL